MKIIISGGNGKLAQKIIEAAKNYEVIAPDKEQMNVYDLTQVEQFISNNKPDVFIHAAAYTKPMSKHEKHPDESIRSNVIGTSNVTLACMKHNVKLVYISTDYVYPGIDGNYSETDSLSPYMERPDGIAKYGWSKLGGECSVRIYDNSLILRVCICDYPFPHNQALTDVKKSMMYNFEAAEIIVKLLDQKGVINIGGKSQTVYDFASKDNPNIKKVRKQDIKDVYIAPDTSMDTSKMRRIIND